MAESSIPWKHLCVALLRRRELLLVPGPNKIFSSEESCPLQKDFAHLHVRNILPEYFCELFIDLVILKLIA